MKNKFILRKFLEKMRARKIEEMYQNYLYNTHWARDFKKRYFPSDLSLSDKLIFDFGCGRGRHAALVSQLGSTVLGVDILPQEFWRKIPYASFLVGSDRELPCIKNDSFDLVITMQVLMYLEDDHGAIREIHRILKKGGYVLLQVANKKNLYTLVRKKPIISDSRLKRYYTIDEIEDLVRSAGFLIERIWTEKFYAPFSPIPINYFLEIISPPWALNLASLLTPPAWRGLINILARKP
jgi:SAM-dependent methyltransferase